MAAAPKKRKCLKRGAHNKCLKRAKLRYAPDRGSRGAFPTSKRRTRYTKRVMRKSKTVPLLGIAAALGVVYLVTK